MPSILIIEDDEGIRKANTFAFSHEGFNVTTAANGAEALVRVEDRQFDAILLDMLMIGMSGLDFLKSYDVRAKSPATRVVGLTNLDNPGIEQKARDLGVVAYLNKSQYDPTQLVAYVRQLLSSQAPAAPAAPGTASAQPTSPFPPIQ